MKPFVIQKASLMERVRSNRDEHRSIFEKAIDGYNRAASEFFTDQLERAKQGKPFVTYFAEPVPEDHTADYDAVLDGWEMSIEDTIELTTAEFRQYVRDEWGWKKEFIATSSNYLGE